MPLPLHGNDLVKDFFLSEAQKPAKCAYANIPEALLCLGNSISILNVSLYRTCRAFIISPTTRRLIILVVVGSSWPMRNVTVCCGCVLTHLIVSEITFYIHTPTNFSTV